jgi:hypothetical protein
MNKQLHRANGVEAPEVKQALAKAEEYAKLARSAQTLEERDHYDPAASNCSQVLESPLAISGWSFCTIGRGTHQPFP